MTTEGRFGPYSLHESVGSGGMAIVHRATIELGGGVRREVALKRLLPHLADDDRSVEDFVREAKLAAHLRHPNIAGIFELGKIGPTYFIAMELVRGVSLMSLLRKASRDQLLPPLGAVLSIMIEVCDALDHAHNGTSEQGEPIVLVHRDLTPSNVLVCDDGHIKIIDFGIAKAMTGDLVTNSGLIKGKRGYMSLEALRAEHVDARADIFSAGVVMWELLTGNRLFESASDWEAADVIERTVVEPPSSFNAACTPEIDRIVLRAVSVRTADRWPSAEAMQRALVRAARPTPVSPDEVVRWREALRLETALEPYAAFTVEEESAAAPRAISQDFPHEPSGAFLREAGSVSVHDVPVPFKPDDFERKAPQRNASVMRTPAAGVRTMPASRRLPVMTTPRRQPAPTRPAEPPARQAAPARDAVPIGKLPSAPAKQVGKHIVQRAPATPAAPPAPPRRTAPPPFRKSRPPLRAPAPSTAIDVVPRSTVLDTQPTKVVGSDERFAHEQDTIAELDATDLLDED